MLYYIGYGVTCNINRLALPYCKNDSCECYKYWKHQMVVPRVVGTSRLDQVVYSTINIPVESYKNDMIVLHANVIDVDNKYIVIIGESGVGKTTLTIHCITHRKNHFKFVADDLVFMDERCVIYPCCCRPILFRTGKKPMYISSTKLLNGNNINSQPKKASCIVSLYRGPEAIDRHHALINNVWNVTARNIAALMSVPFIQSPVFIDNIEKSIEVLYDNLSNKEII